MSGVHILYPVAAVDRQKKTGEQRDQCPHLIGFGRAGYTRGGSFRRACGGGGRGVAAARVKEG